MSVVVVVVVVGLCLSDKLNRIYNEKGENSILIIKDNPSFVYLCQSFATNDDRQLTFSSQ
jgi:hypothetical protein